MNGWTDGWVDRWTYRQTYRWAGKYLDKRAETFVEEAWRRARLSGQVRSLVSLYIPSHTLPYLPGIALRHSH